MTSVNVLTRTYRRAHFLKLPLCALGLVVLLTACVTPHKYEPTSVYRAPKDIPLAASTPLPLTVRMVKLVDASPPDDRADHPLYGDGISATTPDRFRGTLEDALTEAVAKDFSRHEVFKDLAQNRNNEDLRLEGKIHRFYQRRSEYLWTLCCGLIGILLPFPLMREEGEVDLELTLSHSDGNLVRSYRGTTFVNELR